MNFIAITYALTACVPRCVAWRRVLAALGALCMAGLVLAQQLVPVPVLSARVIDRTGTLNSAQLQALEDKLSAFEREKGSQIVVLLVPSTQPEDIESFTQRLGDTWKIGRKEVGDGLIIVVAKNDRRVRIATAKTLEGAIPDLAAKRIIDEVITPKFRAGDFAGGLNLATDRVMGLIQGEALPPPEQASGSGNFGNAGGLDDWLPFMVFALFFIPIASGIAKAFLGRKLGSLAVAGGTGYLVWFALASLGLAVAAGVFALIYSLISGFASAPSRSAGRRGGWGPVVVDNSGGWGGGWSGGGGGGGGFSSGGGGDFGGGGSSGSW
jgi:uncharacterized protein